MRPTIPIACDTSYLDTYIGEALLSIAGLSYDSNRERLRYVLTAYIISYLTIRE